MTKKDQDLASESYLFIEVKRQKMGGTVLPKSMMEYIEMQKNSELPTNPFDNPSNIANRLSSSVPEDDEELLEYEQSLFSAQNAEGATDYAEGVVDYLAQMLTEDNDTTRNSDTTQSNDTMRGSDTTQDNVTMRDRDNGSQPVKQRKSKRLKANRLGKVGPATKRARK